MEVQRRTAALSMPLLSGARNRTAGGACSCDAGTANSRVGRSMAPEAEMTAGFMW